MKKSEYMNMGLRLRSQLRIVELHWCNFIRVVSGSLDSLDSYPPNYDLGSLENFH